MGNGRLALALPLLAFVQVPELSEGKIYFQEKFNDEGWSDRWSVPSKWKPETELGQWKWTSGEWFGGGEENKGIKTSEDSRFYGLSAKLDSEFTNSEDLIIQLSIKHEQKMDCGGAYIKLLGDIDQDAFGGDTPYQIMFGPDMCGTVNSKTHVIFNYPPKDENLLVKDEIKMERDQLSHLYTLHVKADGTFQVLIDQQSVRSGRLEEGWDFLLPKEIKDPDQSKPLDWVDEKKIPDPEDFKPEGYDDIPSEIPDPAAEKPEDWDEEEDGEWEPPMIRNPEYKGEWKPRMIANPDYKGSWEHPMIPNPDYSPDDNLHRRCNQCTYIGFELWQVKSGTIFDDIIVTDSMDEAQVFAEEWASRKDAEKEMFDRIQEKKAVDAAKDPNDENWGMDDDLSDEHYEL